MKKPRDGNQSPFTGIKSVDQQTENQILVWIDNFGSVDFERIEESGTQGWFSYIWMLICEILLLQGKYVPSRYTVWKLKKLNNPF